MKKIIIASLLLSTSGFCLADGYVYDHQGNAYYYQDDKPNYPTAAEMQQQIDSYRQRTQRLRRLREESQHPNRGIYQQDSIPIRRGIYFNGQQNNDMDDDD